MRSSHLLLGLLASVIASASFAANRPAGYVTICNEGKTCSAPANTQVAYGRADKFTFKILIKHLASHPGVRISVKLALGDD